MMIRLVYVFLLRLHPPCFRRRFGDEMLLVFDQAAGKWSAGHLLADAFLSVWRQWALRPDFREPLLSASVAQQSLDGVPVFYTFGSSAPRRGALFQGVVLSVFVFSAISMLIS